MARKTNVQLLQEALAAGDVAKATELAKKIKVPEKPAKAKKGDKKVIIIPSEIVETPIDKPQNAVKIRRVHANLDNGIAETAPARVPARNTKRAGISAGDRPMSITPMVARRMDGWKDTGVEDKGDSIKTNPKLGAQRITERNRAPAEQVEAQCSTCENWFIIPESHLGLSGSNWRCSKCCARRG